MASGIPVDIQEEMTCPICLELLKEPLILDCGHNFCQACITANKESVVSQEGNNCPVCRVSYQPGSLRPNRLLAILLQRFREVKLNLEEEQKPDLCVRHGEKLLLFCKEDGKIICWLCERSQEHCGHQTMLLEDATKEYEMKLQKTLGRLREKEREAETVETDFRKQRTLWKSQIEKERQRIQTEFKQLRDVLDSEEQRELQKLKTEEEKLAEAESELVQQSQFVREVISDLEHRLQGSVMELLQDVNDIMKRSDTLILKEPQPFSMDEMCKSLAPGLRGFLQTCNELKHAQQFWVDVTLEPASWKCNVNVSPDGRQVRYEQKTPGISFAQSTYPLKNSQFCSFKYGNVMLSGGSLGFPLSNTAFGFNTAQSLKTERVKIVYSEDYGVFGVRFNNLDLGKYYWEVEVTHKHAWVLGVYDAGHSQQNQMYSIPETQVLGSCPSQKHIYSLYQPKYGYLVIGLQNKSEYIAFLNSSTSDAKIMPLSISIPPRRVGIFLDTKSGTLSFYNIIDQGSPIYRFSSFSFSQEVRPYLNPMRCEAPMTMC